MHYTTAISVILFSVFLFIGLNTFAQRIVPIVQRAIKSQTGLTYEAVILSLRVATLIFDVHHVLMFMSSKLLPKFGEKDPETILPVFERVAEPYWNNWAQTVTTLIASGFCFFPFLSSLSLFCDGSNR